jgi:hypothetical protein
MQAAAYFGEPAPADRRGHEPGGQAHDRRNLGTFPQMARRPAAPSACPPPLQALNASPLANTGLYTAGEDVGEGGEGRGEGDTSSPQEQVDDAEEAGDAAGEIARDTAAGGEAGGVQEADGAGEDEAEVGQENGEDDGG